MSLRGAARADKIAVSLSDFGWGAERIALLDHSTLPWYGGFGETMELAATPLTALTSLGGRDALSLVGQYAAHVAYLQFAGIAEHEFDASDWAVVRKRGADVRLVRIRASAAQGEGESPALTLIGSLAKVVAAPRLESIGRSWGSGDAVYREVRRRLATETADLSWLTRSACGILASPGEDQISAVLGGGRLTLSYEDRNVIETVKRALAHDAERVVVFGAESSLVRPYSAFGASLVSKSRSDAAAIAEEFAATIEAQTVIAVTNWDQVDECSRQALRLLLDLTAGCSWIIPPEMVALFNLRRPIEPADPSRFFVIAPSTRALLTLQQNIALLPSELRRERVECFIESESYEKYLENGVAPELATWAHPELREPVRSFLGALALCGTRFSRSAAESILTELGCHLTLEQLATEGTFDAEGEDVGFVNPESAAALTLVIPTGSVKALVDVGIRADLACGARLAAAELALRHRDAAAAVAILGDCSDEELRSAGDLLVVIPPAAASTSERVATSAVETLLQRGKYFRARQQAALLADGGYFVALAERRLGNYRAALALTESRTDDRSLLLRAELLRLTGAYDQAEVVVEEISQRSNPETRDAARYERELLALETVRVAEHAPTVPKEDDYFGQRLVAYRSLAERRYDDAIRHGLRAAQIAPDVPSRIDAQLDLLYAEFLRGEWEGARVAARTLLAEIDETEGDRAAGGVLLTLAYLCADSGLWREAEEKIARLREFYRDTGDERRLRETDVVVAHLALCRGEWEEGKTLAGPLLEDVRGELRDAAALVVDEANWISGEAHAPVATSPSACSELHDRQLLLAYRRGQPVTAALSRFSAALLEFERHALRGRETPPPEAETRSDALKLFRSLQAIVRRHDAPFARRIAERLAAELGISHDRVASPPGGSNELAILQRLAGSSFPFASDLFGSRWLFATRNRLGRWTTSGTMEYPKPEELNALLSSHDRRWMTVSDTALISVAGCERWSDATRGAVASLVRVKWELDNASRLIAHESESDAIAPAPKFEGIIGDSAAIREVMRMLPRLARRDVPVLILGESGTGKELIARAIHQESSRRSRCFTPVNCAALPEQLIESELFGHAKGAFTGADRDRVGLIEATDGGTLFLDEIGELPGAAQAKLLRFLQEGEIRRVGETAIRRADVRIVAATHRKLEEWVDDGRFRADLFYRIRGVDLVVPALRERASDVLTLAHHFLAAERAKHRSGPDRLSDEVEQIFVSYEWPGNVRELQNTIRAAHAIAGESRTILLEHLPERIRKLRPMRRAASGYQEAVLRFRKDLIERSLRETQGNQNRAAQILGMSRQALAYQIRELGILVK